jgi:hypothetical protein
VGLMVLFMVFVLTPCMASCMLCCFVGCRKEGRAFASSFRHFVGIVSEEDTRDRPNSDVESPEPVAWIRTE